MKLFGLLLIAACMAHATDMQQQHPITFVLDNPVAFDTMEEAAIAALKVVATKPTAGFYEWGGAIIKLVNGKYMPMPPNTNFSGDSVNIQEDVGAFIGTEVATYHTHPCLPEHYVEFFSPQDLIDPIFLHRTSFMGDFCTGNVHEFKPGDKPDATAVGRDGGAGLMLTRGRIIGQFTVPRDMMVAE